MKRVLTFVFAFLMAASISLVAQDTDKKTDKAEKKEAKAAAKDKSMTLTGWIKDQDGKTMFVNDKDKQAWNISNMDAVKGHEGHHVKIRAKLNESDHSVNVEKVTMLRKSKQSAEEKKAEDEKK